MWRGRSTASGDGSNEPSWMGRQCVSTFPRAGQLRQHLPPSRAVVLGNVGFLTKGYHKGG